MECTVQLADGAWLLVRPITPDDKDALRAGLERLGRESRYARFLTPVGTFSERELRYLTDVDHHDHEALVAEDAATSDGVGVARFVRLPDEPGVAEFAVAVADDWQGRGAGTVLLRLLAERAREEGVERFRGLMLARNRPIQELVGMLGEPRVLERGPGTVELEVELPERGPCEDLETMLRCAARGDHGLRPRIAA